uniref:PHD-type domain-containing protein n=1 Tax=Glossina austeni TaxID=7395 RepID=A0A1A9VHT1_GLOAU
MMNNNYNTSNLPTQQQPLTIPSHVGTSQPQASSTPLSSYFNGQHHHHHIHTHQTHNHHPQLAVAMAGGALYADRTPLQLSANSLDKTYFATSAGTLGAVNSVSGSQFYGTTRPSTSALNASATQSNTILITNNFPHQTTSAPTIDQRTLPGSTATGNLRIVSTSTNSPTTLPITTAPLQHSPHIYNLSNNINKEVQHLFPAHLASFTSSAAELLPQHFTGTQHFNAAQAQQHVAASAGTAITPLSHGFYVASDMQSSSPMASNASHKILNNINGNAHVSTATPTNTTLVTSGTPNSSTTTAGSTVVLDRINICINNLYTDTTGSTNASSSIPAQQPSPIIPAIQHKAVIESVVVQPPLPSEDSFESSNALVIDEPDSTTTATTPHTPPTTPENTPSLLGNSSGSSGGDNNSSLITTTITSSCSGNNSPSTSAAVKNLETFSSLMASKKNFSNFALISQKKNLKETDICIARDSKQTCNKDTINSPIKISSSPHILTTTSIPITPLTPTSPIILKSKMEIAAKDSSKSVAVANFCMGEDVLIKRADGRFYLGTIIDYVRPQYRIRFDDKTEVWSISEEMRKLGGSSANSAREDKPQHDQPMCIACKLTVPDAKVETCERCGRGYHRKCTRETELGSGVWLCKRCAKPMKLLQNNSDIDGEDNICLNLSYNRFSLVWDKKHRVNEEQTYCYCGRSGKFDHNMLQCCRCRNWYHTHCTQQSYKELLRGDGYFVFSCSVCNQGPEFLRRLQMDWLDFLHLILYNLSLAKKYHQKYHHFIRDILPFAEEHKRSLPIPPEWRVMPSGEFKENLRRTLKENKDSFICGREAKQFFYGLRNITPPVIPEITVSPDDILTDDYLKEKFQLKIYTSLEDKVIEIIDLRGIDQEKNFEAIPTTKSQLEDSSLHYRDIYEFRIEEEDAEHDHDDNDDDSSEDEIPIKHIKDKVKKSLGKIDVEDDNANDAVSIDPEPTEKILQRPLTPETPTEPQIDKEMVIRTTKKGDTSPALVVEEKFSSETVTSNEDDHKQSAQKPLTENNTKKDALKPVKNSRKRKAFTLTKTYDCHRLIETSSDENSSSSSRGTSLDLIIPPPKNFLGQNNPFRMVTPKKKAAEIGVLGGVKKSVSFARNSRTILKSSIFNTTALSFSSKLAALKSAGIFPNLSAGNLAKAAGQPRTVRTIKRRLSAKDITIGPNQEVRRRRTRRLSANVEVISTTTINPIPTNFFPIHAKDLLAAAAASTSSAAALFTTQTKINTLVPPISSENNANSNSPSAHCLPATLVQNDSTVSQASETKPMPAHGRRLRQRPQKISPNNSRRSSISSTSSTCTTTVLATGTIPTTNNTLSSNQTSVVSSEDLKQTVNKYFGAVNRIESGEQFSIRAKRQLPNGQMQYLIEWGETIAAATTGAINFTKPISTNQEDIAQNPNAIENEKPIDLLENSLLSEELSIAD